MCRMINLLLLFFFFFSSRRRHTRSLRDWSSDVCSSDLGAAKDLAISTANVPTPPAAPLIRTFFPDEILLLSLTPPRRRPCKAVNPAIGTEAACSNDTLAGLETTLESAAHAYSAKAPRVHPKTSSPGLNCVTLLPTASTGRPGPRRVVDPLVCRARLACEGDRACPS